MKYLLQCPTCGSKTMVTAGQAGQSLQCSCGKILEVPSIRGLRELESVVEETIPSPIWSARQGIVFLGLAITVIAILAAGAIALLRPSSADRQLFELPINKGDIQLEVNKLSPAEAFIRFEPVVSSLPGFVEVISQNALPPHLILDLQLLAKFEGPGPQPMAPKSAAGLAKQAGERNAEIISRLQKRRAMNDGLWLVAIAAVFGVLLAGSSLVFSVETPPRRSAARGR